MPRPPREIVENGAYHVFTRGNNQMAVFRDDMDRGVYVEMLEAVVRSWRWRCLAYCLMTNHVHLLIETPMANLSEGMQVLQGRYARSFNLRHGRSGHLFQGRFGAVLIQSDAHLCSTAAYIARNPVAAAMCARPDAWVWSSYRATVRGPAPTWLDTERLLQFFGSRRELAARAYADMVAWQVQPDAA
jgi:REP element-mobilizing transposase RayT